MTKSKTAFPFILITSLFFLWGFAHNLDPILIPHLKKSFTLTTVEATLADSAVFISYFVMALPAGFIMKRYGTITVYTVMAICFFMSIMFPTIFALGIHGLKGDTALGSSLIIMSIVGGAILPRAFGYISDVTGNVQYGYIIPAVCFTMVTYFGFRGHKTANVSAKSIPVSIL
ncbi:MFS transporter [Mucilaginibacter gracilis]|nr:hypothetical protein [Mucilaginibacter gracilis]